ncbi:MAG TPA: tetratricopeptide repeat protein [Opitutaceae bacterium]|nr:tetratricopeptide repeat protein [Opitutaceae bacterium]
MAPPASSVAPISRRPFRAYAAWMVAALVLAAAAYLPALADPFVFDDGPAIVDNRSIRAAATAFAPPVNTTASGRPVLNASLALSYALGGAGPAGFRGLNLLIHLAGALTLWGVLRRTLRGRDAEFAAATAASLWLLQPLQTESVTYIVQRAESLMGLLYLFTLYACIRGLEGTRRARGGWFGASVAACLLGMGTKEVMVSAPVLVLLWDRTFRAGSLGAAWRARWPVYLGYAATWLWLAVLVLSTHGRAGTAGTESGVGFGTYWLTQPGAILRYLRLALWPHPLVFDYGTEWVNRPLAALPGVLAVAAAAFGVAVAAWRRTAGWRALGYAGGWFFAILAPTSLVPGNRQTAAEHRMYLALIPVLALLVLAIVRLLGRRRALAIALALPAFAVLTAARNRDYRSVLALWRDTVAKQPGNPHARVDLGNALAADPVNAAAAAAEYEGAIRLAPDLPQAHNDLANLWARIPGRLDDAIAESRRTLRLAPTLAEAHNNLANALNSAGRPSEAAAEYEAALRLKPDYAIAHFNLAITLLNFPGRMDEAIAHAETAVRLDPSMSAARELLADLRAQERKGLR